MLAFEDANVYTDSTTMWAAGAFPRAGLRLLLMVANLLDKTMVQNDNV